MTPWINKRLRSTESKQIEEVGRPRITKNKEDGPSLFLSYGGDITKEIIALCDGKSNPFRNFTAKEIILATNNFQKIEISQITMYNVQGRRVSLYHGCFENRSILVEILNVDNIESSRAQFARGIAVNSRLNHHKNALKLLGVCLEPSFPAIVYEDLEGLRNLEDHLSEIDITKARLGWSNRLRIAKGIANILVFLHTGFSTPLIYRDLKPSWIFIDQSGVPKLINFSLCLALPPGKHEVDDGPILGTLGYISREYLNTGIVSTKCDVYSFGVVLLNLLTGRRIHDLMTEENNLDYTLLKWSIKKSIREKNDLLKIVDWRLLATGGALEHEEQMQAFLNLAIKCINEDGVNQPEMIDVAKELKQIEKIQ